MSDASNASAKWPVGADPERLDVQNGGFGQTTGAAFYDNEARLLQRKERTRVGTAADAKNFRFRVG